MEKQEKAFILNKGLILGLVLIFFPIIDLFYGLDMNWINYILIFGLLWMVVYSYLVVKWSKEFASYYEIFPFKDAFRTLFLISAVAFGVLTVGKIVLWNIYAPEKYIEINLRNPQTQYNLALKEISNDDRDCNYDSLSLFEDRNCLIIYGCQDSLIINVDSTNKIEIISKLDYINTFISPALDQWRKIEENGISKTHFIGVLIYSLFFISIYCAILALFVRKKEKFIKTN